MTKENGVVVVHENGTESEEHEAQTEVKSGWADSMAKILGSNKPKHKKTLILSRAKKDFEIRTKPVLAADTSIAVVSNGDKLSDDDNDGNEMPAVKKAKQAEDTVISVKAQRKLELDKKRERRVWENLNRVKPDPTLPPERNRERELAKIATQGVVQLFNAVNLQQKAVKDKLNYVKKSEFKKDKILNDSKNIFDSAMEQSKELLEDDSDSNSD